MSVIETFSKRQRRQHKPGPDVYQYKDLPREFRVQVCHIWRTSVGPYVAASYVNSAPASNRWWITIHDAMARELGVFTLQAGADDPFVSCQNFLIGAPVPHALDLIEISFRAIEVGISKIPPHLWNSTNITQDAADAVEELNHRFKEHAIGYQFVDGELIRLDSEFLHAAVVVPALQLLRDAKFHGAADEFRRAHEHYRSGNHKESITEASKAFESTMKAICSERKWPYPDNAAAAALISVVFDRGLVPAALSSHFSSLRSVLESGVPPIRNRLGAHGQGTDVVEVPDYLVAYALHLVATNIVFLVDAHRAR
jgi:hypothetical protein